jgi:predicted ATP-grasp superfamily ATP-dependent carboligase
MKETPEPHIDYLKIGQTLVQSGKGGQAPAWIFGSSVNTLSFVRSLGRKGIPCVVLDGSEMIGARSKYTAFVRISLTELSSESGIDCLINAARKYDQKPIVFATSDEHNEFLARHGDTIKEYCDFLVPTPKTIDTILDKRRQYETAERIGIPLPSSLYPESIEDIAVLKSKLNFPCIIKPCKAHIGRQLLGGKKVRVVNNYNELIECWAQLGKRSAEFMVQEIIPGGDDDLFGYLAFWSKDSSEVAWITKQKLRQNPPIYGDGALQQSIDCEDARELSTRLLHELGYQGFVGVEFKRDPRDGKLKLMEINPRTVSGNQLAVSSDVDFPFIAYSLLVNPSYHYAGKFRPGVRFINEDWNFRAYLILRKTGEMHLFSYLLELFRSDSRAIWAIDDLNPAWFTFRGLFKDMIRKLRKA